MITLDLIKIPCPLCGSESYSDLYTRKDNLKIVRCNTCALAYLNPRPTEKTIPLLYDSTYFTGGNQMIAQGYQYLDDELENIKDPDRKWKPILHKITRLVNSSPLEVLDVGCAIGGFLHLAKTIYSWNIQGVEVSQYAAEYAKQHFGLQVFNGFLKDAHFPENRFDMVTLFDVIEHDPYPLALLQEIHRILKPNGWIVLLTPNIKQADRYGQDWEGLKISFEHLVYFSPVTLPDALSKTGFDTRSLSTQGLQSGLQKTLSVKPGISIEEVKNLSFQQKLFYGIKQSMPFLKPVWKSFNNLLNASELKKGYGYHLFVMAQKKS